MDPSAKDSNIADVAKPTVLEECSEGDRSANDFALSDVVSIDGREAIVIMDLRPDGHQFIKVRWLDDCSESHCIGVDSVVRIEPTFGKGDGITVDGREGTIIMDLRPDGHDYVKVQWADGLSDGELVAASSVKLTRRKCSNNDFGKGDTVIVDGRKGTLIMDLRPAQEFVKVQWLDDGEDSGVLPAYTVALVSKAPPAAATSEDSSCPDASNGASASSAIDTDPSSTTPPGALQEALRRADYEPVCLDIQEQSPERSPEPRSNCHGVVTTLDKEQGHGFITCKKNHGFMNSEDYDVFFYYTDCMDGHPAEGDKVRFYTEDNEIDQKIAKCIVGCSLPFPEDSKKTVKCEGRAKSFIADVISNEYGTIAYEGSEVFFHISECIDGLPARGDLVEFYLHRKGEGKGKSSDRVTCITGGTHALRAQEKGRGKGKPPKGKHKAPMVVAPYAQDMPGKGKGRKGKEDEQAAAYHAAELAALYSSNTYGMKGPPWGPAYYGPAGKGKDKKGKAAGRALHEEGSAEDLIEPYKESLDDKAIAALRRVGRASVARILKEFEQRKAGIHNPSAWISSIVGNQGGGRVVLPSERGGHPY